MRRKVPRLFNRLTKRSADRIAAARNPPGLYPDGEGLYLQVANGGSASWLLVYRLKPRRRKMGLGPLRLVSLEEARARRDAAHKQLLEGADPLASRAVRRAKRAKAATFRDAARAYIETTESRRKNPKHAAQWRMTLLGEAPEGEKTATQRLPTAILDLPIGDVDTQAVIGVLRPIWTSKPETASRLRGRIEAVLGYAALHGLAGDVDPNRPNPARWKDHLQFALPTKGEVRDVKHHAALAYHDVPTFIRKLKTLARAWPPAASSSGF